MGRSATVFACSACGQETPKWHGRCPGCGEWNTIVEEARAAPEGRSRKTGRALRPVPLGEVEAPAVERLTTGIGELDRILGGGLVPGSLVLIGGSPGVGKSTLTSMALGHPEGAGGRWGRGGGGGGGGAGGGGGRGAGCGRHASGGRRGGCGWGPRPTSTP